MEFESGRRARAIKNVSLAEEYLHDHFFGYPVVPKSLVIEGMAQTGGLLVCEHNRLTEKVVLAKIASVRFFSEAVPGDTLTYTTTIETIHKDGAMVSATSHKGDQLHAEMEVVFAHLNEQYSQKTLIDPATMIHMLRILKVYEVGRAANGSPLVEPPGFLDGNGREPGIKDLGAKS